MKTMNDFAMIESIVRFQRPAVVLGLAAPLRGRAQLAGRRPFGRRAPGGDASRARPQPAELRLPQRGKGHLSLSVLK